jgi:four helix bundle protein
MARYKDLEIYNKALELFFRTHQLSLRLPQYEMYEQGSQIRRSADSIVSQIVEGYCRNRYKADFIKYLIYAFASNHETSNHCIKIKTLYPDLFEEFNQLEAEYDQLGKQIHKFIEYVETSWRSK